MNAYAGIARMPHISFFNFAPALQQSTQVKLGQSKVVAKDGFDIFIGQGMVL